MEKIGVTNDWMNSNRSGKPNEPGHVVHTGRRLAELRGISYEELDRTVERNAARVLGW